MSDAITAEDLLVYIGTYTDGDSLGIYLARMNSTTGELSSAQLAAATRNPSFLALHPSGRFLYSVGETSVVGGDETGTVEAFAIQQPSGRLQPLNKTGTGGTAPCHLVVDQQGRFVLVANYGSGSVAVVAIQEDGSLGDTTSFHQHHGSSVHPRRQTHPYTHSVNLDRDGRYAFTADLVAHPQFMYQPE